MCCCSPVFKAAKLFRKECSDKTYDGLYYDDMIRDLGRLVIKCSNFFTTDVQPIYTDKGLAYGITQYGSDDLLLVHDDDCPDMELPEWCSSEFLPAGWNKAAAISGIIHADIVKRLNIKEGDDTKRFTPEEPYLAYHRQSGQAIPLYERIMRAWYKIANNKYFSAITGNVKIVLIYGIVYAATGFLLALIDGIYYYKTFICGGAMLGVGYALIMLFSNYVSSLKEKRRKSRKSRK